jgi:ribonuclease Z
LERPILVPVRGRVVDDAGRPIANANVSVSLSTVGDAVAYLTDFLLDTAAFERLLPALRGCRVVVCESAYLQEDEELARVNYHMTARQAATLAREAGVDKLILIHLSDRYRPAQWPQFLQEARAKKSVSSCHHDSFFWRSASRRFPLSSA